MLGQDQSPNLPAYSADVPFLNAEEDWAIYDTIQIGKDVVKEKLGFGSYPALGAVASWPFFDQRKSDIGIAYTNRDSNEGLEFAFKCYSIGVRFVAPEGYALDEVVATGLHNAAIGSIFTNMLLEHVGFRLKISQDDKLIHTCYLAPEGAGPNGVNLVQQPAAATSTIGSYNNANGQPHLSDRWKWPNSIEMPRGVTFSLRMEPSEYARTLLTAMPGPVSYLFNSSGVETECPAHALIRVSMIGVRGVQQRNALHF
jgi:hypothetical protein